MCVCVRLCLSVPGFVFLYFSQFWFKGKKDIEIVSVPKDTFPVSAPAKFILVQLSLYSGYSRIQGVQVAFKCRKHVIKDPCLKPVLLKVGCDDSHRSVTHWLCKMIHNQRGDYYSHKTNILCPLLTPTLSVYICKLWYHCDTSICHEISHFTQFAQHGLLASREKKWIKNDLWSTPDIKHIHFRCWDYDEGHLKSF